MQHFKNFKSLKTLKKKQSLTLAVISIFLAAIFALNGCSTTKSRIQERSATFANLPPEDQLKIQNGEVDLGFTPDMVYMAKGKPKEESTRRVDGKSVLIWRYPGPRVVAPQSAAGPSTSFSSPYGHPQFSGQPSTPSPMFYESRGFTIEFEDGKVRRIIDPR